MNLTKAIEVLTKYVQNQDARIDKLVDSIDVLIDRESIHVPGKASKVHKIEHPVKQIPQTKEVQVSSKGIIPIDQLKESLKGPSNKNMMLSTKSFLTYAKPYTTRIDILKCLSVINP